jgi:hypothetical protein
MPLVPEAVGVEWGLVPKEKTYVMLQVKVSCGWGSELSHIPEWLKSLFFFWHFVQLAWIFALCHVTMQVRRGGHSHL